MLFYRDYDTQRRLDAVSERVAFTPPLCVVACIAIVYILCLTDAILPLSRNRLPIAPLHPLPRGMPPARASTQ